MTDVKIDTFRSSVYDKEFSGLETESETIDDFSQYSDQMNNENQERLSTDSSPTTPISKTIPVKINGDNINKINLHNSLNLSLNEEKDTSEDVMVQISKKTTIKKIISKTTLVNGVTQASEFEEFIIHDSHTDGSSDKLKGLKCDKNHTDLDFQHEMNENYSNGSLLDPSHNEDGCFINETIKATKAQNNFHGKSTHIKSPELCISHNNENSKDFLLSNESNVEESQAHTPKNEKYINNKNRNINENVDFDKIVGKEHQISSQNLNEKEKNKIDKHLNFSETNKTLPLKEKNLIETKRIDYLFKNDKYPNKEMESKSKSRSSGSYSPSHKLRNIEQNLKVNTNNIDFNDKNELKLDKRNIVDFKSQDFYWKDYKYNDKKDHISEKPKFIMSKRKDNANKNKHKNYSDQCDNFKSKHLQSKTKFHDINNATFRKPMKWVDPLKSYHLKYDFKDNGRSMQQWIKQKQDALHRTDPNSNVRNSISKKGIKCRTTSFTKSFSKVPSNDKYNSQKDIKEFIIRGNIKENLFQIRHPYPTYEEQGYIFYYPTNKRSFENFDSDENMDFKPLGPYTLNHNEYKPKQQLLDFHKETRDDLPIEVSKMLNKFEINDKERQKKPNNLRDRRNNEEMTYFHRNCYLPVSCRSNCCCCSIPCSCLMRKEKVLERYKYLSYERLNDKVNEKSQVMEYNDDSDWISETNSYIEKEMNNNSNKIEFLEAQLENIEDKIRNIKPNGERSVFECAMDLECQCREIEQQLEYLYRGPRNIRKAA